MTWWIWIIFGLLLLAAEVVVTWLLVERFTFRHRHPLVGSLSQRMSGRGSMS